MTEVIDPDLFQEEFARYLEQVAMEQGFVDHPEFYRGVLAEPEQIADDTRPRALEPLTALAIPIERHNSPNQYTPAQAKERWGLDRTFTEITIHHWGADGQDFDNVVSWLTNPDAQASSHYVVQGTDEHGNKAPRIAQLVPETNVAWTNGSRAGNATSITIECRPEATAEDYAVVAMLIRDIRTRRADYPIRPHNVWTSTDCPGDWDLIELDRLARAGARWTCTKVLWRGKYQCAHSIPKLDRFAKTTPNDILITLIQGAWSLGSASGDTHAGGGAGDHKGSGYSWTLMGVAETAGRKVWLLLWRRKYIANLWSQHGHYLDPECPSLSAAAQSQFYLFEKGFDGLVGNKPDTGYRGTAAEIMRLFKSRLTVDPAPVVGSGGTLEGIMALSAKEEEFAQRVSSLTAAKTIGKRLPDAQGAQLQSHIYNANVKAGRAQHGTERIEALLKDQTGLADAIASRLKDAGPISREMLTEAIRAAFAEAFATQPRALGEDEAQESLSGDLLLDDEEFDRLNDQHVAFSDD